MAYAETPKGETKWEQVVRNAKAFGTFLYDKDKGEVMGRGPESWGKITIFFVIYYLCLSAFFAAMLNVFLTTMPDPKDGPKLTQYLAGSSVPCGPHIHLMVQVLDYSLTDDMQHNKWYLAGGQSSPTL